MAGYLLTNKTTDDPCVMGFNIDNGAISQIIRKKAPHRRVITLQLDGDELDAALWGLDHYRKV